MEERFFALWRDTFSVFIVWIKTTTIVMNDRGLSHHITDFCQYDKFTTNKRIYLNLNVQLKHQANVGLPSLM